MKYYSEMSEDAFLSYVERHSETPRAMFNKQMVAEMLRLAGHKDNAEKVFIGVKEWYSIDMRDLVAEAKRNKIVHTMKIVK